MPGGRRPRSSRGWLGLTLASLLVSPRAAADGKSPLVATPEEKKAAQTLYDQGAQEYALKAYPKARASFRASYDIVASPASRFMVARTLRDQLQIAEAHAEFERAASEARALSASDDRYKKVAEESEKEAATLARFVGRLTVHVRDGEGAKIQIGRRELAADRWGKPITVPAGANAVVATTRDGRRVGRWVRVPAGDSAEVELDLAPPAPPAEAPPAPMASRAGPGDTRTDRAPAAPSAKPAAPLAARAPGPTKEAPVAAAAPAPGDAPHAKRASLVPYAIVTGVVGVAGFATFAVAGAMNVATHARLEEACPGGACPPDHADDIDAGRTQQTVANVGLVVGAVGAAAAVTLVAIELGRSPDGRSSALSIGPGTVAFGGAF